MYLTTNYDLLPPLINRTELKWIPHFGKSEREWKSEREREMVRPAYFDRNGIKRGVWDEEEDKKLSDHIKQNGHHNWRLLPLYAGNPDFSD